MSHFEQFSIDELRTLREELMLSGLDSFQAGTLLSSFLSTKGYGVSTDDARYVASCFDSSRLTLPHLQQELEKLAFVM